MLTQEYFEGLVPAIFNQYVKYNSYDEVEPIQHPVYEDSYSLEEIMNPESKEECATSVKDKVFSLLWRKVFPKNFKEKEYGKTIACTFGVIIDLIREKTGTSLNIAQVRNELYNEYAKYVPTLEGQILDIMIAQGKKLLANQVKAKKLSFVDLVHAESYYLTTIDYYLLVNKFQIPTFFISGQNLFETGFSTHEFACYGALDNEFCFIVVPGFKAEQIPSFKIIESNDNNSFFSLSVLKNSENLYSALDKIKSVQDYLTSYTKSSKYVYKKQKPKPKQILLIEDTEEVDTAPQPPKIDAPVRKVSSNSKTKKNMPSSN
jgi:hypothetical protein